MNGAAATFESPSPLPEKAVQLALTAAADQPYFTLDQPEELRRYYDENGYVVVRGLIPPALCDQARGLFEQEVKPFKGFIYRQTTANPERHQFTPQGYMLNPVLNVQSMDSRQFPNFRRTGLEILGHANTLAAVRAILGEQGKLVQSMYFEGNPSTWAHQDTYYLDAEEIGRMAAGWFAVEDIAPGAGRFFIYPKSHLIDIRKNGGDFDIAFNHARYKALVLDVIRNNGLECRAPALAKGDVLFWAAKTIHGSLSTTQPERSRCSFTGHYIPDSSRFLQYQTRVKPLKLARVGEFNVHQPKNLDEPLNRAIFWVETNFPRSFQLAKKLAIKLLVR